MKRLLLFLQLFVLSICAWSTEDIYFRYDNIQYMVISREEKTVKALYAFELEYLDDVDIITGAPLYLIVDFTGDLVIPEQVEHEGVTYTVTAIGSGGKGMAGIKHVKSVHLPNTISSLPDYAFYECREMKSLNIPQSIRRIGKYAFSKCKSWECEELDLSHLESDSIPEGLLDSCVKVKRLKLNPKTRYISRRVFKDCRSLSDISGLDNVEYMSSFDNKEFFPSSTRPSGIEDTPFLKALFDAAPDGAIIYIGHVMYSAKGGDNIETLEIKDGTTQIYTETFGHYYIKVKNLYIPSSVWKTLWAGHFKSWESLETVRIGEGIEEIERDTYSGVFEGCSNLREVILPESLKRISENAFEGFSSLSSIIIPNSVTSIGEYNQEIKGETNVEIIPVSA